MGVGIVKPTEMANKVNLLLSVGGVPHVHWILTTANVTLLATDKAQLQLFVYSKTINIFFFGDTSCNVSIHLGIGKPWKHPRAVTCTEVRLNE